MTVEKTEGAVIKKRGRPKKKDNEENKLKKDVLNIEKYNKEYGEGTVFSGSGLGFIKDKKREDYISTGSKTANYNLSGNKDFGIQRGRIVECYGWEQSGKTTFVLHNLIEPTNNGEKVLYIDGESALDFQYIRKIGVNLDNFYYSQTCCLQDAAELIYRFIEEEGVSVVCIDSIPSLRPREELEGSMDDQFMALHARILGRVVSKINGYCSKKTAITEYGKKPITVYFVNQIRLKVGVFFGSPESTPGGNSVKFFSGYRLKFSKASSKEKVEEESIIDIGGAVNKKKIVRQTFSKVEVLKNKCYPPYKNFIIPLVLGEGYSKKLDLLTYFESVGIIEYKSGHKTVSVLGESMKIDTLMKKIKEDDEFKEKIKKYIK